MWIRLARSRLAFKRMDEDMEAEVGGWRWDVGVGRGTWLIRPVKRRGHKLPHFHRHLRLHLTLTPPSPSPSPSLSLPLPRSLPPLQEWRERREEKRRGE